MRLRTAIAASALAFFSQLPAAADPSPPVASEPFNQVVERVSPHVHVLRSPLAKFIDPTGNVVVIEQSDGLILVDSGGSFGAGKRVVALVKSISPKPVKAVLLTHYHSDHSLGIAAVLAAWPRAEFIAHRGTFVAMREGRPPGAPRSRSLAYETERAERLRDSFARQALEVAQVDSEEERAGWARELATLQQRLSDLPGTYAVLPRRTFTDRLDIPDAVTPVHFLFLGRANTPGDAMAWVPSEGVLATGDVVVQPVPYMFNVYPNEMLRVFDRMRALHFRILVPGHGSLQGADYLDRLSALVREARRQAQPLSRQQLTIEEIQSRTDAAAQREIFSGSDPWIRFWFDNYTWAPLIESIYHETRNEPLGPTPVAKVH